MVGFGGLVGFQYIWKEICHSRQKPETEMSLASTAGQWSKTYLKIHHELL